MSLVCMLMASMLFVMDVHAKDVNDYSDMTSNDWYYPYVADVSSKELMTGLNDTTFGATQTLVRAQFATVLYRMSGTSEYEYAYKFADVPDGQFYSQAVTWANDMGIVTGYESNQLFGTNDPINREQLATMLFRYASSAGDDISSQADYSGFPDSGNVTPFASEAMAWAVGAGIISGDNGYLNPQGTVNRAVCATMIARFTGFIYGEPDIPAEPDSPDVPDDPDYSITPGVPFGPEGDITYIVNLSTKKFHYPDCRSVDKISPENYYSCNIIKDSLISQGYSPCGNCTP